MTAVNHQNNFVTNLTSNTTAGATTTPLNSIPTIDAPFYLAFDATNTNSHYEVVACTSKTATNVNHAATTYDHTTDEEVRMIIPAEEMNNLSTLSDQTDGAWVDWTPSWTNLTIGNGTVTAKYTQIGKTVHFRLSVVLGSTSSVGTTPSFTFPVTVATYGGTQTSYIGSARYYDATGTGNYSGRANTGGVLLVNVVSGTNVLPGGLSATAPFTWATSDEILVTGTYEAA